MKIGYARNVNLNDDLSQQIKVLKNAGCVWIFKDISNKKAFQRPEFSRMIKKLSEGDLLIVRSIDRLGISISELLQIVEELLKKKIEIIGLDDDVHITESISKHFRHFLHAVLNAQRKMLSESTKNGMKKAKENGVTIGKRKGLTNGAVVKAKSAKQLYKKGELTINEMCDKLGIAKSTFYRYIRS